MENKKESLKKNILVVAPHPDDETLGCGGSLLKHSDTGDNLYWLIMTSMHNSNNWTKKQKKIRENEIEKVAKIYNFKKIIKLNHITAELDKIPLNLLISQTGKEISKIKPNTIYIPYVGDIHTDHQITNQVMQACIKSFRYPSIKKVLMYETISETNFNFVNRRLFVPNTFIEITKYLNKKIKIMNIYKSEIHSHPFPRSEVSIQSLSYLRGSQCGVKSAEAFELIYNKL